MALLKTEAEIAVMAEGGRILALILAELKKSVRVGAATMGLERLARKLIKESGSRPAFLGYRPTGARKPYPYALCVSINDVVVHGLPSDYAIREGDLVKLDLGIRHKGFFLDAAATVAAGAIGKQERKLVAATEEALARAIETARLGRTLGDVGAAMEKIARRGGFSVVRKLTGHGIGRDLHEDPAVPNWGEAGDGEEIAPGMVLAIEPMIAMGSGDVRELPDGSFATADGSPSAHFEHTVAITAAGTQILTKV